MKAAKVSMYRPHERLGVSFGDLSRTRQEFASECDVNVLMKRYEKTGVLPQFMQREPRYLDVSEVPQFHEAMDLMVQASASFARLPANVRKEFDNDPEKFVSFAQDRENLDRMREWGLAPPAEPEAAPMRVEVVSAPGGEVPPRAAS